MLTRITPLFSISLFFASILLMEYKDAKAQSRPRSYFDKKEMSVVCKEPLPKFTLDGKTVISNERASNLCKCIWNKFPENGWERQDAIKVFNGQSLGFNTGSFSYRFGKAVKYCEGY